MAQDATLRRITVSNDDGDVYVESSGDGSEIVLKTEKVRVDGDVYCDGSQVGLSARIDALKTKDDALDERIDTLNDTQIELRNDLDALETSTSGRLVTIDTTLTSLASTDASLSATDASLSSRIDALNATDAQLKATDETLATRIASLNATDTVLKGADDDLSSRIDALRDIYVNELNVTDKQLIVTDATLGSRIDDLNATQNELKSADAALSSRIATLESAHTEYERIDDEVASLIDALNATDAAMQATDVSLSDRIDALNSTSQSLSSVDASLASQITSLIPPKCTSPGGIKLRYDGANWTCTCESGWSGTTCETPIASSSPFSLSFDHQQKLTALDGTDSANFGESVSIFEGDAIVGAWKSDENGSDSGSAYVFVYDGSRWMQQQKLVASDSKSGACFGNAVAIFGNTTVVAAYKDSAVASESGAAYVFVRSGDNWTQQQKLVAADGASSDNFGNSVSISGTTIIVGAHMHDENGDNGGAAYIFVRNGTVWTLQQKIMAPDALTPKTSTWPGWLNFGMHVSISNDTAIVSASGDNDNGINSGSVYIFVRSDGVWTQEQKLVASDGASRYAFGVRVHIDGDTVIVGTARDSRYVDDAGSAYIFARNGNIWSEQGILKASDPICEDFGGPVAVSQDYAIVSCWRSDEHGSDSGSVYVFARNGTTWIEHQKIVSSDGAANDNFGRPVSLSGNHLVIGASGDDDNGSDSGSAYVYALV